MSGVPLPGNPIFLGMTAMPVDPNIRVRPNVPKERAATMKRTFTAVALTWLALWGTATRVGAQDAPNPLDAPTPFADDNYAPVVPTEQFGSVPAPTPVPDTGNYGGGYSGGNSPLGGCSCGNGCVGGCEGCATGYTSVFDRLSGCCPPGCVCPKCIVLEQTWFSGSYLFGFTQTRNSPPLVTTSPQGTPRLQAGRLPNATTLFGDEIGGNAAPGMVLDFGRWDRGGRVAFGGRFLYLERDSDGYEAASTGNPILALPYFNVVGGVEDAILLAYPGVSTNGHVSIDADQELASAQALGHFRVMNRSGIRVDFLAGYHFAKLDDSILIRFQTDDADPLNLIPDGTTFDVTDSFSATNQFNGGLIGCSTELRQGRVVLRGRAAVSIGNMRQTVTINGSEVITVPAMNPAVFDDGLYTQQSNIGVRWRDRTAFLPEAQLQLGYRVTPGIEFNIGYSLLYMTHVALAGDHIDHNLDLSQDNGGPVATQPAFAFRDTSLWMQGATVGVTFSR